MELMPGRTLSDIIDEEGALPVPRAVDLILDVIDGLDAAHAAGVIHRDVKPSNCFLDRDGRVKVGDFGLSKSLVSDAHLTRTGAFMGTPLFAAPEQVRSGTVDERTDIYSVGATLFYLIAHRGPFTGDATAVIAQIASDPAPSIRSLCPAVPKDSIAHRADAGEEPRPPRADARCTPTGPATVRIARSDAGAAGPTGGRLLPRYPDGGDGQRLRAILVVVAITAVSFQRGRAFSEVPEWAVAICEMIVFGFLLSYYTVFEGTSGGALRSGGSVCVWCGRTEAGRDSAGRWGAPCSCPASSA